MMMMMMMTMNIFNDVTICLSDSRADLRKLRSQNRIRRFNSTSDFDDLPLFEKPRKVSKIILWSSLYSLHTTTSSRSSRSNSGTNLCQKQGEIFNKSFHINGRLMPSPSIKCTKSMGDLHKLNYNVVSKLKKFPSNFEGTSSSCFMKEINSFENLQSELDEDDLSLFKTAVFKIETPKSAVKTSLKTNMQSKPSNLFKYSIDNSQGINNILDFENNNKTLQKEEKVVANPLKRKNTTASKRRNTISSIALNKLSLSLAVNANTNNNTFTNTNTNNSTDIFENIQDGDLETLQANLNKNKLAVNNLNSDELTALDMALMLDHLPSIRILLSSCALENPMFTSEDRYNRICNVINDLDDKLSEILDNLNVSLLSASQIRDYDQQLKEIDVKIKFYKRMKSNFEAVDKPAAPSHSKLYVHGVDSLLVTFEEPLMNSIVGAFITRYIVEWSIESNFETIIGHASLVDTNQVKSYIINGLVANQNYYVRVSCVNIRGIGAFSQTIPPCLAPSYWRHGQSCQVIQNSQIKQLKDLNKMIDTSKLKSEFLTISDLNKLQRITKPSKKSTIDFKKNIKSLFSLSSLTSQNSNSKSNLTSNVKFAKQIKKGAFYLVMAIYDADRILTTHEDMLPMVEIDEVFSNQSINNDLQFLIKMSFNWSQTESFKTLIEETINTSHLKNRYQLLTVVKHMQSLLEMTELGRVYHQSLKHSNGTVFFVITKNVTSSESSFKENLKFNEMQKLLLKSASSNSKSNGFNKELEHTFLVKNLRGIIDYDRNCAIKLKRGFYVAFLQIQSNIELIKVLVSCKMPNILPNSKIRDNPNITNEEWNLLKSIGTKNHKHFSSLTDSNKNFLQSILKAVNELCNELSLRDDQVQSLRLVTTELIEINSDITILLLSPSAEHICQMNTLSNEPNSNLVSLEQNSTNFTYLPLQIFEAIYLDAYNVEFIRTYVQISIKLEIEHLASVQYQREAFDNLEVSKGKRFVTTVLKYQKMLEELWKSSRWIIQHINNLREKDNKQIERQKEDQATLNLSVLKHFILTETTTNHIKDFITPFCLKCSPKSNIYNQITSCCMCPNIKSNNNSSSDNVSDTFSSSLEDVHSNITKNVYNLATSLANCKKSIPTSDFFLDLNNNYLNPLISNQYQSYSSGSPAISQGILRKLTIYTDFKIDNAIDTYFEVIITSSTKVVDIILGILKKLNDFISKLNRLNNSNKSAYFFEDLLSEQNFSNSLIKLKIMPPNQNITMNSNQITYKHLNSNPSMYYITSVLFDKSEIILVENYVLGDLRAPWSNGKFYLKERVY